MNLKKKSFMKRAATFTISVMLSAVLFVSSFPLFVSAADASETDYVTYPVSEIESTYDGYSPIPLLVIQISFDADGDGVDDNPDGSGYDAVKNPDLPTYGEQWCHTVDSDWTARLFAEEGASLRTYYEYMSDGNFYFSPAAENYGTADDGVIHVILKGVKHMGANAGAENWVHCYKQIIAAADEYVDFSVFDVNKNGRIDTYELGLCFIFGGAETSSSSVNRTEVFGFHAYYKKYDSNNSYDADGVNVSQSGFFGTGSISGGAALNFGVFAHELGHYLGAPDLYDYGSKFDNAVGTLSLMGSGAHGSSPAHLDPWNAMCFGFYDATTVTDGEYTLYSKASETGTYNIIKIATPNPNEYYLIENRWAPTTDTSNFDDAANMHQGIIIYHIDETYYTSDQCNTYDEDNPVDPMMAIYHPTAKNVTVLAPVAFGEGRVWTASSYKFPVSSTWYTSMTAEQAEIMKDLKVEITSGVGTEMTIKISGAAYEPQVSWVASDYDATTTSFTVKGKIALHTNTLNDFRITLTEKSTGKEISSEQIKLKKDGSFEVAFTGLTENTSYVYTLTADASNGTVTESRNAYTEVGEVEQTYFTIYVYKGLSENERAYKVRVDFGEKFTYSFPMNKSGYAFCGWYLDKELTQKYDMNFTQNLRLPRRNIRNA